MVLTNIFIFQNRFMIVSEIKNYFYDLESGELEFDYSFETDSDDTYRKVVIDKEVFESFYDFPTTTNWDDDEGYFEVNLDLDLMDELLIDGLTDYFEVHPDEVTKPIKG